VLFVYLRQSNRPVMAYAIPMVFVVAVTTGAMVVNLFTWVRDASAPGVTMAVGAIILVLELWMIVEAVVILRKIRASDTTPAAA